MQFVNSTVLSAADNQSTNGNQIDANQLIGASFQAVLGDTQAGGTFKLQMSNDINNNQYAAFNFTVTNWTDIPNQSNTITSGASSILTLNTNVYRWLRAVYISTATGAQTIAPIADTGVKQAQTVTTIADTGALEQSTITAIADTAGSLNDTYFTFSNALNVVNYYVWYDDGGGVDPALPGKTGIHVTYSDGDTANTIAGNTRTAITGAVSNVTVSGSTNQVILTNTKLGNSTDAADGAVPTGFGFVINTQGAASNLNSKYFTLSSVNVSTKTQKNFYLWLDVNSQGVDPAVAGKTAIHVTAVAGASANTVGTQVRNAINALTNDFTGTGTNANVIITDVAFGPVTASADGAAPTGFSFGAATTGVASNLNNTYFLLQDEASVHKYYVWMNVDSIGTDPTIVGRTGVPIAFSSGATAGTIGGDLATAIAALNSSASFSTSGSTTVTVTNLVSGPFVPMSDGAPPTHFTFAVTGGGSSTITVNMNATSL